MTLVAIVVHILFGLSTAAKAETTSREFIRVSNYKKLDVNNGLCSNKVHAVHFGKPGLLWIGTDDGLNSYDGYQLRRFVPGGSRSIGGKQVFEICSTKENKLLVALGDDGVDMYDRLDGDFESVAPPDDENYYDSAYGMCVLGDNVYTVYPDCIVRYNGEHGTYQRIDMPKKQPERGVVWGRIKMEVMPGREGLIVMKTGTQSISVLDTRTNEVTEQKIEDQVFDLCPMTSDIVLLGTSSGLVEFNIKEGTLDDVDFLHGHKVYAVAKRTADCDFWVSYDGNHLAKWDMGQDKMIEVVNAPDLMMPQTKVNDMIEDDNGLLWIATSNNGVLMLDTKETKISVSHIETPAASKMAATDICALSPEKIWMSCGIDGIAKINAVEHTAEVIPVPLSNVRSIYARKDGEVYLGTTNTLMRYDEKTGALHKYAFKDSIATEVGRVIVNHIMEDCLGNLWLSTHIGIYKFNGVDFKWIPMDCDDYEEVNYTYEDTDGRIWAATRTAAFVKDADGDHFRRLMRWKRGRNDQGLLCIEELKNKILMGTTTGVVVFDKSTGKVVQSSLANDFASTMVSSIATDDNGVVWLSTSSNIGYVDVNYNAVYRFDARDGLVYFGNESHKFSMRDGVIYFGQPNAVNMISTDEVTFNTKMPKTFVSEVLYGQSGSEKMMKMANDSTYYSKYLMYASVKVELSSSDFTTPSRNRYMYKIDDGEWTLLSGTNEIIISGILPGLYRVRVRSTNADNTWSYHIKTVYIDIKSPMWLSRPAMIFYSILLMAVAWLLLNMRFRAMNARMRQAEDEARAKRLVEAQRNKLAMMNRTTTDSINYAKRIQDALIPKEEQFVDRFNQLFVLFRPKDIVSGDFYCIYYRDGKTFVVSADCTGHGVPGAFISILGITQLNNIIMQQKEDDAGMILTKLQNELHDAVFKTESEEFNDGMDITVCVVHHDEYKINFAGAMNDMFLIRNNEVLTYHGDRRSIGTNLSWSGRVEVSFTSQFIDCQGGDVMYLCSDGFMDQFGGAERKKFKIRRFKNLLLNIHKLPAKDQKIMLNQKLEEWRGALEQTDDVSVIGFEPWA
ncbi:MAG: SpoIIE family protein phosphatase [Bacteroidales bacterium]|nr:SpoIIE family protein phosphatase [Bacteroidales bacterium]